MEEMRELTINKEELYITISLREYRKLVKQVTRFKTRNIQLEDIIKDQERTSAETYRRWWREEEEKTKELTADLEAATAKIAELQVAVELLSDRPVTEGSIHAES